MYVLVGPDPSREDRERVYVGEGEVVLDRLKRHVQDEGKDFWTRACVFTSSDGRLTKAHVKYLESRLIQVAEDRGRAAMENGKASALSWLPEADRSDMDHFIERVLVLLPVLGFDFSRPRAEVLAAEAGPTEPTFTYSLPTKGAAARAREVNGEFIVLKGSTASAKPANSWDTYQDLHKEMLADAVLVQDPNNADLYTFTRDYTFKSPSAAGSIVAASNVSGPAVWCVEGSAQTYREWQDAKIEASEAEAETEPTADEAEVAAAVEPATADVEVVPGSQAE